MAWRQELGEYGLLDSCRTRPNMGRLGRVRGPWQGGEVDIRSIATWSGRGRDSRGWRPRTTERLVNTPVDHPKSGRNRSTTNDDRSRNAPTFRKREAPIRDFLRVTRARDAVRYRTGPWCSSLISVSRTLLPHRDHVQPEWCGPPTGGLGGGHANGFPRQRKPCQSRTISLRPKRQRDPNMEQPTTGFSGNAHRSTRKTGFDCDPFPKWP